MNIRAKFVVSSVTTETGAGGEQIVASAVYGTGSEENKSFSEFTPNGSLSLSITPNAPAYGQLKAGMNIYIDISEAPE